MNEAEAIESSHNVDEVRGTSVLDAVRARRTDIERIVAAHGATNVRIFGSVARGTANGDSDVDLLVDVVADAKGFAYFGLLEDLRRALTAALGHEVDVVDSAALNRLRDRVTQDAVPL